MTEEIQLTRALKSAAIQTPNVIATLMGDRSQTWAELKTTVATLAGGLRNLGVIEEDRVAVLAMNSDRYSHALYATWWAGACVVPVNIRWSVSEMVYSLKDCAAKVLFLDSTFSAMCDEIRKEVKSLEHIVFMDETDPPGSCILLTDLLSESDQVDDAERGGEDLAGIFYTGGTTGFPKGVMLSHRAQGSTSASLVSELSINSTSVYLHAAPMFHVADAAAGGAAMAVGATNVYIASFTPEAFLKAAEEESVTHSLLVPTMIGMLLEDPAFHAGRLKALETLLYGASPMPRSIVEAALEKLPEVNLVQGYGQTESVPITILPAEFHKLGAEYEQRLKSAGRAAIGVEIQVLDEEARELPRGELGEIAVKGPMNMSGYWNNAEQTASTLVDGWVKTGDAGYIDAEGFLYIVDRIKDMIVSGGENVYCAEVESAISTHKAVEQVAVIGIPSDEWGETVHAVIVKRVNEACSIEAIVEHCRGTIANYKLPRSISFIEGALPLSAAGKVLKRELRKPFWEERESNVS